MSGLQYTRAARAHGEKAWGGGSLEGVGVVVVVVGMMTVVGEGEVTNRKLELAVRTRTECY